MQGIYTLLLLVFFVGAQPDANEGNDLNTALQLVIGEMNNDNFFIETWSHFYPFLPIPVPNNCYNGKKVGLDVADESLKSVVERQSLRVGVTPLAALYPSLFSDVNNVSEVKSTSTTASVSTEQNITLDLKVETLDGYEIVCAKEAAKRLGELYGIEIRADFKILPNDSFFPPLVDALNNDEVDVVWSSIFVLDDRRPLIDYVCDSYSTEMVIGAAPGVGSARPDPDGAPINLPCYGGFCDFKPPTPFRLLEINNPDNYYSMNLIVNTTDDFNYTMAPFERLRLFFAEHCPNCTEVDIPAVGYIDQSPITKKSNKTESNSKGTSNASFLSTTTTYIYQSCIIISLVLFIYF